MMPGHFAVLVLAAIGAAKAVQWFALFAFWVSGTDPREFVARILEGD
jgi:hypothetical protein